MTLHPRDYDVLIAQVRNRLRVRTALRGAAITLGAAACSLILAALAAQQLKGKSVLMIALRALPFLLNLLDAHESLHSCRSYRILPARRVPIGTTGVQAYVRALARAFLFPINLLL